MQTKRSQAITAAALVVSTALLGAVARGAWRGAPGTNNTAGTVFSAPSNGQVSFSGTLDRTTVLLGENGQARLELVMAAAANGALPSQTRRPTDLVIVLDRSGSMDGKKMDDARAAVRQLLAQLGPQDRFALVTYSDGATLAIPLATVGARSRAAWESVISSVRPEGGTNMASGLDLGIDLVERSRGDVHVPRVILISDGLANQGDATPQGLTERARRAARGEYMLSTVGIGADFNEYLMTALADAGTGNYYYVQNSQSLGEVFAREFDAARATVASGLAVQIQPGPKVQVLDAAGYPLERTADGVVFRPGSLFAGQERRVWLTLAVPQNALGEYDLGSFALSYSGGSGERSILRLADVPRIACVNNEELFFAGVDRDAWSRSVTVEGYNKMQEEVAREVKAGRRDEALKRLRDFKDETAALNARLQSAPVAQQLKETDRLEAEVGAAFAGDRQKERQNELSKSKSYDALEYRRAGSKK
jgi:Ca-activated chloride channel family protein